MNEVEKLGCDLILTDVVVALSIAREKLLVFLNRNKQGKKIMTPPPAQLEVVSEVEFENVYKIHVCEIVYIDGSRNVEVRHLVEKDAPHTFCRSLVELANLHLHRDLELMASVKRAPKDQEN